MNNEQWKTGILNGVRTDPSLVTRIVEMVQLNQELTEIGLIERRSIEQILFSPPSSEADSKALRYATLCYDVATAITPDKEQVPKVATWLFRNCRTLMFLTEEGAEPAAKKVGQDSEPERISVALSSRKRFPAWGWVAVAVLVLVVAGVALRTRNEPVPMTPEEREYIAWFDDISGRVYESNGMFEDALEAFRRNPSDQLQLIIVARELVKLGIYYEEATEKMPPESLDEVHGGLLTALGEYKAANAALVKEDGNQADLALFLAHMAQGEKELLQSGKLYRKWRSNHY